MFTHTVTYKDFNDVEHTEKLHFHLSSPEMMDLQFSAEVGGDIAEFVRVGLASGKGRELWIMFKLLIVNSYGRRSEDGSKFVKKPEFTEDFINSPAFEKFFEWLLLDSPDGKHATEFWNGIVPQRIKDETEKMELDGGQGSKKKLSELDQAELLKLLQEKLQQPQKVIDA